ncbi:MAG: ABC transporter ATP-binding protein [Hyphomicrobiales bacterium]|nr:ABC transporter ATP-binding protein [Hyphomicrobiales bacterium]
MGDALALEPGLASRDGLAISCRSVTKSYRSSAATVPALRGIDLDVARGELLMVVGPSGCGKTTLISVIASILRQDAGQCRVLGCDLDGMNEAERAQFRRDRIGFVFQLFNLLPALTVAENVAIPLLIAGASWRSARARAAEGLETVGLGARSTALPGELSGGQQQRVAIARALAHDPSLVVCDEPTSSLDHAAGQAVMETLRTTGRSSGRTIVVVTHDERIFGFADRIARMDDGRIVEIVRSDGRDALQ